MFNFVQSLQDYLVNFAPFLSSATLFVILMSLGLLAATIIFFRAGLKLVRKRRLRKKAKVIPLKKPETPAEAQKDDSKKSVLQRKKDRWAEFLAFFGYAPIGPMARTFLKAVQLMNEYIGGSNARYKVPWFVLLGSENSGKSTFIENTRMAQPLGEPILAPTNENPGCNWWFFQHGTVIDLEGNILIKEKSVDSNTKLWKRFLTLLSHFRVRRPLDGVILTIPCDELVGSTRASRETLIERAQYVYEKLAMIEKRLSLNVPVYVVITKCDKLYGFKSFTKSLPEELRNEMFGWSSTYPLDHAYSPRWMDDIYSYLDDSLATDQLEVFSENIESDLRDGLTLFPDEVKTLRPALEIYFDTLFRKVGYHDAFFFRGIYFCGDISDRDDSTSTPSDPTALAEASSESKNQTADTGTQTEATAPPKTAALNAPSQTIASYDLVGPRIITYVKDLIQNKIFPEYSLARPGVKRLIASSRSINVIRTTMLALTVVCGLGMWNAYNFISSSKNQVEPILRQIVFSLDIMSQASLKQKSALFSTQFFAQQTKTLLSFMTNLQQTSFASIFIPASWFCSLSQDIRDSITIAFDDIILRSLFLELNRKAEQITKEPLPYTGAGVKFVTYDAPLNTPEYLILQGYVESITQLETNVKKYESIGKGATMDDLASLIKFAFAYKLPKNFYQNSTLYEKALDKAKKKDIDFSQYGLSAQNRMRLLYFEFLKTIFGENASYKQLVRLVAELSVQGGDAVTSDDLKNIMQQINISVALMSDSSLNWIGKRAFDPGDPYDVMMLNVASSKLLGNNLANQLSSQAQKGFDRLKSILANYSTDTTGNIFQVQKGDLVASPSKGLVQLQSDLSQFMKEAFMKPVLTESKMQIEIPPGKLLFWNDKLLKKAVQTVTTFESFTIDQLPTYPSDLQEVLRLLGLQETRKSVENIIANSQSFIDAPASFSGSALEDSMRTQTFNAKKVLSTFTELLGLLRKQDIPLTYIKVRDLVTVQMYSLLDTIDQFLDSEALYTPELGDFSWWDGQSNMSYQAYDVRDKAGLKSYLEVQRERASFLATSYAGELVSFLDSGEFKLAPIDLPLLTRWEQIIQQVNDYKRKKPGNSILVLENFILYEMNSLTEDNCLQSLNEAVQEDTLGDFFLQQKNQLQINILRKCKELTGASSTKAYQSLEGFFNDNLAGRFPFVGTQAYKSSGNAEPENIRQFFRMYDALGKKALSYLEKNQHLGAEASRAIQFLRAMEAVNKFFSPFLEDNKPGSMPAYKFDVEFRINRQREVGASQILDWVLNVGTDVIDNRSKDKTGTWRFGSALSLSLKWPSRGPSSPVADQKQPHLSIEGSEAVFNYDGDWAFLRLLMAQEAPASELQNYRDRDPQTLMFVIPTISTFEPNRPSVLDTRVFVRITPHASKKEGGERLQVPFFPPAAPVLGPGQRSDRRQAQRSDHRQAQRPDRRHRR